MHVFLHQDCKNIVQGVEIVQEPGKSLERRFRALGCNTAFGISGYVETSMDR